METITQDMIELIKKPLPAEAVTQHPTKTYLSSIKAIYVLERLNEVFWIGAWSVKTDQVWEVLNWMVVVKVTFEIPKYWIYYECFWGNDNWWESNKNFDLWDAYKWATTDAITKICSYMWIWMDVFKGKQKGKWWKPKWDEAPKVWYNDTKKHISQWEDMVAEWKTTWKEILAKVTANWVCINGKDKELILALDK